MLQANECNFLCIRSWQIPYLKQKKRLRSLHFRRPPPHSGSGGGGGIVGTTPTLNSLAGMVPASLCHTYYNATKGERENTQRAREVPPTLTSNFPFFQRGKCTQRGEKRKKGKCQIFLMWQFSLFFRSPHLPAYFLFPSLFLYPSPIAPSSFSFLLLFLRACRKTKTEKKRAQFQAIFIPPEIRKSLLNKQ